MFTDAERFWSPNKVETLVSIYTPTFNTGLALHEAFVSLLAQTYQNWEWVIVDDASTDQTTKNILKTLSRHERTRVLQGPGDHNVGSMKDQASRLCRGEILVELDHDDILLPHALARIVQAFENNPNVDFVYGNSAYFAGSEPKKTHEGDDVREVKIEGKTWYETRRKDLAARVGVGDGPESLWAWGCQGGPLHPQAFRAKAFFELGGYNYGLRFGEDLDLMLRFMLNRKWLHLDELLYLYRWDVANASKLHALEVMQCLAAVRKQHERAVHAFSRALKTAQEDTQQFTGVSVIVLDQTGGMAAVETMESVVEHMPGAERILVTTNNVESQVGALANVHLQYPDRLAPNIAYHYGAQYARNDVIVTMPIESRFKAQPHGFIKATRKHFNVTREDGIRAYKNTHYPEPYTFKLISVIIPTYKRTKALNRAIKSVLGQRDVEFRNIEIIVVGDGCPELDMNLNANIPGCDVRVFNLSKNYNDRGAAARNHGILHASGKYIAYLDDDNTWHSYHLDTLRFAMKDASWAFSWMQTNDGVVHKLKGNACGEIDTSAIMHKRSLAFKYGLWRSDKVAGYTHDWDLVKRWLAAGLEGNCTFLPSLNYTLHPRID